MTHTTNKEDELEHLAMNIVYQIGDVLYEALPPTVAHEFFVEARQSTNDVAIDFVMKLVRQHYLSLLPEKQPLQATPDVEHAHPFEQSRSLDQQKGFNEAVSLMEQRIKGDRHG